MSLSDLPLTYSDDRENTGRAWLHQGWPRSCDVKIVGRMVCQPEHPDAIGQYVYMLDIDAKNLTQKQAAALATILQRFARKGSILRGSQA